MSDFLTEEQQQIRDVARKFAQKEIEPLANEIDRTEETPHALIAQIADLGFYGLAIPEEYGGSAAGLTTMCVVLEEIAKASPALAGMLAVQMILCPMAVMAVGTEEQKRRILPNVANGTRLLAYSASEATGAVDQEAYQTRLTEDGDGYVLDGSKLFCTQGEAKTYLVAAKTSRDGKTGIGGVIVEQEYDGFNVGPYEDKLGWRGTNTGPISFSNVRIPKENVLGDLLTGWTDHGVANVANLIAHAVTSLGCAQGLMDKTLVYVKERQLYGAPMTQLSPVTDRLATIHNRLEACRAMCYNAARLFDEGRAERFSICFSCKSFVCETAYDCCGGLLQMWGGSGIMNSTGVNRYLRDARAKMIAEAATEFHNFLVAREVLGLIEE